MSATTGRAARGVACHCRGLGWFATLLVLFAALGPAAAAGQQMPRERLVAALDSIARAHAANPMVAGLSVAVVQGTDTLLMRGYGRVDLAWDLPTPPDASASYEIGSITKQFTAAAILLLVEEGKLDLDADITKYLEDFNTHSHTIPLRRLLDHTSGIPSYTEMAAFGGIMAKALPRDTLVSIIENQPLDFEPGTEQRYNNSAYFLLGLIIEKVSGQPYAEFVRSRLFEPAGMRDSYYCSESDVRPRKAHGYDAAPSGLIEKRFLVHTWPYAAGSLCSTVRDLVRWNHALHGGQLLRPESYKAMTTPQPLLDGTPLSYAMGLGVAERGGARVFMHGGGINGFLSHLMYVPDRQLSIVALQNSTGPRSPEMLTSALADLLLGRPQPPKAVPYTGDPAALTGEFAGQGRGTHMHITVSVEDGKPVVTWNGRTLPPVHVGDGVFVAGSTRFRFVLDANGRASELRVEQGGGVFRLRRVR